MKPEVSYQLVAPRAMEEFMSPQKLTHRDAAREARLRAFARRLGYRLEKDLTRTRACQPHLLDYFYSLSAMAACGVRKLRQGRPRREGLSAR